MISRVADRLATTASLAPGPLQHGVMALLPEHPSTTPLAVASLQHPSSLSEQPGGYGAHPAMLDAATHTAANFVPVAEAQQGEAACPSPA